MSAHAYVQYADLPEALLTTARRRFECETGLHVIAIEGCPFCGEIRDAGGGVQIEYPWPHNLSLRHALGDWLTHNGIAFTVVM